jgi:hypothetical protein
VLGAEKLVSKFELILRKYHIYRTNDVGLLSCAVERKLYDLCLLVYFDIH